MEPAILIKHIYDVTSLSKSLLDSYQVSKMLDEVINHIENVYSNILKGELQSANDLIIVASKKGIDGLEDIRYAIMHLTSAYNICNSALNEKVTEGILYWKKQRDLISDKKTFMESLIIICVLIVALYGSLKDTVNKDVFIKKAMIRWEDYLSSYFCNYLNTDMLRSINPDFITEHIVFDEDVFRKWIQYDSAPDPGDCKHKEIYPSELGKKYLKKEKEKLLMELNFWLKNLEYNINTISTHI